LEIYNQLVRPTMTEADCFDVVARSAEFENVVCRDEERQELLKLLSEATQVRAQRDSVMHVADILCVFIHVFATLTTCMCIYVEKYKDRAKRSAHESRS
jgi:hypothetical protein